jgi:hypothetical protein
MWWILPLLMVPPVMLAFFLARRKSAGRRRRSAEWDDLGRRGKMIAEQLAELQGITDRKNA